MDRNIAQPNLSGGVPTEINAKRALVECIADGIPPEVFTYLAGGFVGEKL